MSESERRLADTTGRFLQVVADGDRVGDPQWTNGRVLLSNQRLILVGRGGKRTIPLAEVSAIRSSRDVETAVAGESQYASVRVGGDVILVTTADHGSFEVDLYSAVLDGESIRVRHPAVKGGVVQETEWERTRVEMEDADRIGLGTTGGAYVGIDLGDVVDVRASERTVDGEPRQVVEVEHTDGETSVETYLAGSSSSCSLLQSLLAQGLDRTSGPVDLDPTEKQVLMALYSGVSSFDIPEFTGLSVDEVEETFERLIELDVLDEVRLRREVSLTSRGRNLASEAISDE